MSDSGKNSAFKCLAGLVAASTLALSVSSCSYHRKASAGAYGVPVSTTAPEAAGERPPALPQDDPGTLLAARASFLLGVLAVQEGGANGAAYFDGAEALTSIPDYVLFYRSRAHALGKDYEKALSGLDSLINDYPGSVLLPEALYSRSLALMGAGKEREALYGLEAFVSAYPKNPLVPEALLESAAVSLRLNDIDGARAAIKRILVDFPADAAAGKAKAIAADIEAAGGAAPELTPEERYRRARGLFRNARFKEAAAEFAALAADPEGRFRDRAVIDSAVSSIRLKRYDEASALLAGYLNGAHTATAGLKAEALYWSALAALRQGNDERLLEAEDRLSREHPRSLEYARTLLLLGRHYESRDMGKEAIDVYGKVMDGFKGTYFAKEAVWSTGWLHYRAGRFEDAQRVFSSYSGRGNGGGGNMRFLYWSGRSAENMGEHAQAVFSYRSLCDAYGSDYYCKMAEKRMRALGSVQPAEVLSPDRAVKPVSALNRPPLDGEAASISKDPHFIAARELITLGMGARAAAEIRVLTEIYSKEPDSLVEIAGLFYRAGDFHGAFKVYSTHLSALDGTDYPHDLSVLSFPPSLVELVREKTPPGSVDPYLVAAVMREESSFNPNAVSITGALGLMQIMPSTGRFVAGRLGTDVKDPDEFLDPGLNIRLGSWYLGHLARRFNNDVVLTIAGYNAGPGAVSKWLRTLPPEPDEFIESIPYPETRGYAKKVLKSYSEFLRVGGVDTTGFMDRPVLLPGTDEEAVENEGEAAIHAPEIATDAGQS